MHDFGYELQIYDLARSPPLEESMGDFTSNRTVGRLYTMIDVCTPGNTLTKRSGVFEERLKKFNEEYDNRLF